MHVDARTRQTVLRKQLVDGRAALAARRADEPSLFRQLCKTPATGQRMTFSRDHAKRTGDQLFEVKRPYRPFRVGNPSSIHDREFKP